MSALNESRLADAEKAMYDNADYVAADSQVKAEAYATALRRKIGLIAEFASRGAQAESMRHDIATLEKMLTKVEDFVAKRRSRAKAGFRLHGMTRMPLRQS